MGVLESKLGELSQRLLMPAQAPAHYGHAAVFPDATPGSLLLLGHISLAIPKLSPLQFYVKGLGGPVTETGDLLQVAAGVTAVHLHTGSTFAQTWPGHIYCWVKDARMTLEGCLALDPEVVEDVHRLTDEKAVDALVLREPLGQNCFVINPAPKGGLVDKIQNLSQHTSQCGAGAANLLAIIDATHLIAPGTSEAVRRFYEEIVGTTVSQQKDRIIVPFSLGESLHQTLTFIEDESVSLVEDEKDQPVPGLCMYFPSTEMFQQAFRRCSDAGILESPGTLEEAIESSEFRFRRCINPETKKSVLQLLHVMRVQQHPGCPLPEDFVRHEECVAQDMQNADTLPKMTLSDVSLHDKVDDAWVVINGRVLDVTDWISVHPWHIIMGDYGKDISTQWNMIHKPGTWEDKLAFPRGPKLVGYIDDTDEAYGRLAGA